MQLISHAREAKLFTTMSKTIQFTQTPLNRILRKIYRKSTHVAVKSIREYFTGAVSQAIEGKATFLF